MRPPAACRVRLQTSRLAVATLLLIVLTALEAVAQTSCAEAQVAVQVLGSGGPHPVGARSSSGYLIWRAGRAIAMIDAGGGTFLRFGETGAKLADLSVVAISHLHPDHVADLPALLWLSETVRTRPLTVVGPSGAAGAPFPSLTTFLRRLFDADSGAYPVLAGTLGQRGQGARLNPVVIDASVGTTSAAHADSILQVDAIGVPHGPVPSLGYRVRVGGRSIVFGADQNGSDPGFKAFASGADLLVLHFALSATAGEPMVRLHARPTTVGEMARDAKPKQLLLSHLIEVPAAAANRDWGSLADLDRAMTEVRARYQGPVATATDLHCVVLP